MNHTHDCDGCGKDLRIHDHDEKACIESAKLTCPHGQLARSCPICERDETIKGLREAIEHCASLTDQCSCRSCAKVLETCRTALSGGTP